MKFVDDEQKLSAGIKPNKYRLTGINNRRYLGNKYKLLPFIKNVIETECGEILTFADVFAGTGAVASAFTDKRLILNDLLYSNYICHFAWFGSMSFSVEKIESLIVYYNESSVIGDNYMTDNFADTYFSWRNCSKIGFIREDIEEKFIKKEINFREKALLITSLLYGMDKIANTVGHYDAYRKVEIEEKDLVLPLPLINVTVNENNQCYNMDANDLVKCISADLVYIDPPYNSRQYSDAYHLLENVARWEKPSVKGIAKKMNREHIKSDYCTVKAADAFQNLIENINAKYILVSYNNTGVKANNRSNAKITDKQILDILKRKGKVKIFSESHKAFSTGKSNIVDNQERLFLCEVSEPLPLVESPLNYLGSKFRILPQLLKHFPSHTDIFVDLFSGGCNVGANVNSDLVVFNDKENYISGLFNALIDKGVLNSIEKIIRIVSDFSLSDTYTNGYSMYGCNSSLGLSLYNKERFLELRRHFNRLETKDSDYYFYLFVLIVFSFNNQIRFNRKGEYNLPVGKRDFNANMRLKLNSFINRLQSIHHKFSSNDFRDFDFESLTNKSFVYIDPPYLITCATYNESSGWTNKDELDLLCLIDELNSRKIKFGLSNILESKGERNTILEKWISERDHKVIIIDRSYANSNYQTRNKVAKTVEVYVTNHWGG